MSQKDETILLVAGSKKAPLICELSTYKDIQLLDIRKYFTHKDSGDLVATKKGVALTRIQYEALAEVFSDKADIIESWFEHDSSSQGVNSKSLDAARHAMEDYSVKISEWKGLEVSRYEQMGSESVLYLNKKHPWIAKLLELTSANIDNTLLDHIATLLQANHKAQNLLDTKNATAMEVSETIEANWGLYSKLGTESNNRNA